MYGLLLVPFAIPFLSVGTLHLNSEGIEMGRRNEPWFWEARGEWFVKINGKRERLGADKDEAFRQFHKLKSQDPKQQSVTDDSLVAILDAFLDWTHENRAEHTYLGYKAKIESFCKMYPTITIKELTTTHVTNWINNQSEWNSTTKRNAITAIQRSLNWATKNRGLERNPIKGMEKPEAKRRTETLTPEEFELILANTPDQQFRDLLIVSWDVGARPQEIKTLEARHVDLAKSRAVLLTEESKGKRQPRALYFPTERTMEIITRLVAEHPDGKIFRNKRKTPWTRHSVKCRFARLESKLGRRYTQYMFRHTWISRKIVAGVDSHVVAKLSGHSDTSMIDRVYSHAADDYSYMLEQAKKDIKPA